MATLRMCGHVAGQEVWISGNGALSLLSPPQGWRTMWTLSHSEGPVCINCREISPMPLHLPSTLSEMCHSITRSRRPIWNSVTWSFYEAMPLLLCLVAQSCLTLCNPMDLLCPWGFSRQEYCSGLACPYLGDLPNPGIEPRSPTLQVDSLPAEPRGKPQRYIYISISIFSSPACKYIYIYI